MSTSERGAQTGTGRWSPPGSRPGPGSSTLRQRYEWYCERQTSELLSLVSREALRSLYGHARNWAARRGEHESKDPMATLRRFCARVLPLPPFDVWAEDFRRNRAAYLYDDLEPPVRTRTEPVTVEVRSIVYRERPWTVELRLFGDESVWRGFMVFRAGKATSFTTADVFCEDSPGLIRDRFLSLESETLRAFLRSSLP